MERWAGRVAVVTGASSGIGAAIAEELVKKGLKVVGLARRKERLEELKNTLKGEKGEFHPVICDVTKESEVKEAFAFVKKELGGADILVNNAGVGYHNVLIDGPVDHWKGIVDVNLMAVSVCTKEALASMKEKGVDDGHIININSVAGHRIPQEGGYMYTATKHAVTVLTEGLRRELVKKNSRIKVTSLSPGWVKTEIIQSSRATTYGDEIFELFPTLNVKDIVEATLYIIGTPPNVQVEELIITAVYNEDTKQ